MIFQLTDEIIREAFAKTGVNTKYFPVYEAEVKRRYNSLQENNPDDEESTEEDNNVFISLDLTNDYIPYYASEREKGHSHQWSHLYASDKVSEEKEYWCIQNALREIANEEDKEKELDIHARSINKDPIFVDRYKCLLFEDFENICENAEKYCYIYHQCIDNGKSENYAHAYADACNRGISEYCWDIQAQAYELAKTQGMDNDSASSFAYCCGDAWANGLSLGMKSFMERYNENWQRDFYISMLRAQKYSENEINEILRWS